MPKNTKNTKPAAPKAVKAKKADKVAEESCSKPQKTSICKLPGRL